MQIQVSTRQPHLLRSFQQEFGVDILFDNQKVAAKADLIFLCVLPNQTTEVFRDIRDVMIERIQAARKDKNLVSPLIISTAAAIGYRKLKLMLSDEAVFLRTNIHVPVIKEYLRRSQAIVQANISGKQSADGKSATAS